MEFEDLIRITRTRWRVILGLLVLSMGLCAAYLFVTPPTYSSTAKIYVSMDTTTTADASAVQYALSQQVVSFAGLAETAAVTQPVATKLGLDKSANVAAMVSAKVETGTVVIDVTATNREQAQAQQLAQATAGQLVSTIMSLQKGTHATITDPASFPIAPIAPQKALDLVVATLIGLLLGLSAAFLRDRLDKTVRTEKQVELATGSPVLARVIQDAQTATKPLLSDIGEFASRAEALRLLRTNLQFVDLDHPPRVFVVTSSIAAEGKTQISTNLAISMAKAGHRTLLVDGDLRRPTAASLLGLEPNIGLTTVLTGQIDLAKAIQVHPDSGLHLLAAGKRPPNPTEVLQTQATRDLIGALREAYDAVIIDAPPLLPVADPAVLASAADGVIVVLRHGTTTVQQLEVAAARLQSVGARIFGVVMNMVPRPDPGAYAYYMEYAPIAGKPEPRKGERRKKAQQSA